MKSILAVCAFMFSTTSAFADFIDCRRDDTAIAGGAAGAAWGGDHGIVKSWLPTQIWIDEEKNEYGTSYHKASALSLRENWNGYKLYARTQRDLKQWGPCAIIVPMWLSSMLFYR